MQKKRFLFSILFFSFICMIFLILIPHGYYMFDEKSSVAHKDESETYKGVGVYIINLDRCKDRYDYVIDNISALNYPVQRISAVEGKKLSLDEINKKADLETMSYWNNSVGAVGCALSHYKTWETFLESNFEYALIFEDDVQFDPKILKQAVEDVIKISPQWDMCMFGISFYQKPTLFDLHLKQIENNLNVYALLKKRLTTACYMINRKAAQKYMDSFFPIKMPVDVYYFRSWEFDINVVGVLPVIVQQDFGDSNINYEKKRLPFLKKLKRTYYSQKANIMIMISGFKTWFAYKSEKGKK